MQPCGLRDLARPWGRQSFGLKAGRVADCARGTLGRKGHVSERERELGARQASFVSVTIILLVAEDDMINQLDAE